MSNELSFHIFSELRFRSIATVKCSLELSLVCKHTDPHDLVRGLVLLMHTNVANSYIGLGGIKDITEFIDSCA